jgi:Mg2+-importing ATPase
VLSTQRAAIEKQFEKLSAEGFRVLGVATRPLPGPGCTADDEHDMTFAGFLVFSDPPKPQAATAIANLTDLGIEVRLITGDNRLAAAHAAAAVGLSAGNVMTGEELDRLTDDELTHSASISTIFAEVQPTQKERLVRALQTGGRVVGYLGDGINDAPALNAADVGISVDTAVDVAKQSAAIVLLERELATIADGVRLGRQTFANTVKYINVTTSASFGNVLSMAAAALFLPFLPMLPRQILLLNFLSDSPAFTLARDRVDEEMLARPRTWDITSIRNFMLTFGAISSCFDIVTFITLRRGFDAGPELFRSGWFLGSVLTELAVMLVLRTRRPFFRSRPSWALLVSTGLIALVTAALPFSPLAASMELVALPSAVLLAVLTITAAYIAVSELAKRFTNAWM